MILGEKELLHQIETGGIIIKPFDKALVNPNSINLRLSDCLQTYDNPVLDAKKNNPTTEVPIPDEGFILHPGELYLGTTVEWTESHNFVPQIEGRSSLARLGIEFHISAGFGDVGFKGRWTLEITATKAVKIYPYMEVVQIFFHTIQGPGRRYNGRYQNQHSIQGSRLWKSL